MRELAENIIRLKQKNTLWNFGMLEDEILLTDINSLEATLESMDTETLIYCVNIVLGNIQ